MAHYWTPNPKRERQWLCKNCGCKRYVRATGEYFYHNPQIAGFYGIIDEPVCCQLLTQEEKIGIIMKEYVPKTEFEPPKRNEMKHAQHAWRQSHHTSWQEKCANCGTVRWKKQGTYRYYCSRVSGFEIDFEPDCISIIKVERTPTLF